MSIGLYPESQSQDAPNPWCFMKMLEIETGSEEWPSFQRRCSSERELIGYERGIFNSPWVCFLECGIQDNPGKIIFI